MWASIRIVAEGGILHEEFHSPAFSKTGGPFRIVRLWVNLPAKDKMTEPRYHSIWAADIPSVELPDGGDQAAGEAEMVLLDRAGAGTTLKADGDAIVLILTGDPIAEPVVGRGPFVMNSEEEIPQAIADFNSGRFGRMIYA